MTRPATSRYAAAVGRGVDHLVHALSELRVRICPHLTWVELEDVAPVLPYVTSRGRADVALHRQVCAECLTSRIVGVLQ